MTAQETIKRFEQNWKLSENDSLPTLRLPALKVQEPLVTVIIPTHNYGHLISETIDSVLSQTCQDLEIIVVDDGSIDDTEQVVRSYPNVKYVYQEHRGNKTPARAINTGLKMAEGHYIICLGADDMLNSTYIEKCLRIMSKDPKTGIVFTGAKEFGASNKNRVPRQLHHRFSVFREPHGQIGAMMARREVYFGPQQFDGNYSEFLENLSIPDGIGGYDENLHSLEDWDFFIRAGLTGWKIRSISQALHYARVHVGRVTEHAEVSELWRKYPMMRGYALLSRVFDAAVLCVRHPRVFCSRFALKLRFRRNFVGLTESCPDASPFVFTKKT